MYFFLKEDSLCCKYKSKTVSDLSVRLQYQGEHFDLLSINSNKWTISDNGRFAFCCVENFGTFELRVSKTDGGLNLKAILKTDANFTVKKATTLAIEGRLFVKPNVAVYNECVEGRVCDLEMESEPHTTALIKDQDITAVQYVAFKCEKNYYGVLGFTTFKEYFGMIKLCENGSFSAFTDMALEEVYPSKIIKTDNLFIRIERNNTDILTEYGKKIAKEHRIKTKVDLPVGWCSWYYYGPNISQETILENTRILKDKKLPIKYVQIDDGWQKCSGDWEENERFSMGMKPLADKIKQSGFIPGIWITPVYFASESKTFKEHPEWFVKDDKGNVLPERLIDYSVKGACEWLFDLGRKVSVEWGYRYVKIDLVTWKLAISGYKKKGFNGLDNCKKMFEILRSAVTKDTVLLACTSPLSAVAGLTECVRISRDIFERWESLKNVAKQVLDRYFVSEYMCHDPDCLMVRSVEQHDAEAFRICTRDAREVRSFVTFMSASGGSLMLSDKLSLLNEHDFNLIKTLFPINDIPAKPLDLFERNVPSVLYYGKRKGLDMYALFNWEDFTDERTVDFGSSKYVKLFYADKIVKSDGKFSLKLLPHDSEVIYVADSEESFSVLTTSILP